MSHRSAKVCSRGELRVGMYRIVITAKVRKPVEVRLAEAALERGHGR